MKNYEIKLTSECNCWVDDIRNDEGVVIDCNDVCWQSHILSINGIDVLESVQYDGYHALNPRLKIDRIPEEILDEMRIGDMSPHPGHDAESMAFKIQVYLEGLPQDTRFFRDNERGFANEYEIVIAGPNAGDDEINEDWDEIDAEEAAREIAYDGDDATAAYNSVRIL